MHHHDILTEALTRFAHDYAGHDREEILRHLRKTTGGTEGDKVAEVKTVPMPALPPKKDNNKGGDNGPPSPPVCGP